MIERECGLSILRKNILKNSMRLDCRIITILVTLYMSIVIYMSLFDTLLVFIAFPFLFLGIYIIITTITPRIETFSPSLSKDKIFFSDSVFFFVVFTIVFVFQLLYWSAYYPGGFNLDAYGQWDQVHGNMKLNNWHPVFTTCCYWLLTRIYDNFAFCIFVQLFVFSISISYLLLVLFRLKISALKLFLIAIYISVNPAIGLNNICLYKDVPFSIALIWMLVILFKIYISKGEWLRSTLNVCGILLTMLSITLIRHNGLFLVIPIWVGLLLFFKKHRKTVLGIISLYTVVFVIIQGPVYSFFSVEKHSNIIGETVGIPMAVMANNFVTDVENTPRDVQVFLLNIASEEEWKANYVLGEWDSCKWEFGGIDLFQGEGIEKFIKLTIASIFASPETAYDSIRENTRVVWQIFGNVEWDTWVYVEENDFGISINYNDKCKKIVEGILDVSLSIIGTFFCWNIGVPNILLLLLTLYVVIRKEYEKQIFLWPIVSYNLLTMLLLCGPSHRYFYFNNMLLFPIIIFIVRIK